MFCHRKNTQKLPDLYVLSKNLLVTTLTMGLALLHKLTFSTHSIPIYTLNEIHP